MLIAFALGATSPQPDHTLDGVYGEFPYLPGSPAVRLDGHRVHIGLEQDHGPVREGPQCRVVSQGWAVFERVP